MLLIERWKNGSGMARIVCYIYTARRFQRKRSRRSYHGTADPPFKPPGKSVQYLAYFISL
jgi:hypothetical protein